jgi:hypothetical protein
VTALTGLTGVSSSSITNTGLTSGRVVYSGTGGLQTNSANLTFDGTTLTTTGVSNTGTSTIVKLLTVGNTSFNGTTVFAAATPAKLYMGTGTVTDTTSAIGATNAVGAVASLAITPIAATNTSVTYTDAATLYIAGAPSAGTNITITNPYALYIAAGNVYLGGGTANGVAYLNANKVLTTGSALTFDGTAIASTGSGTQSLTVTSSATAAYLQATGAGTVNTRLQSNTTTGQVGTLSNHNFLIQTNSNNVGTFDTSGNFGLGVTPSAWVGYKVLQAGIGSFIGGSSGAYLLQDNAYTDNSGAGWKYINSSYAAAQYYAASGAHVWRTAPSGTAGNAITFTQAMTLDASGNLGLGVTPVSSYAGYKTYQIASQGVISSDATSNSELEINNNAYRAPSTATLTYINSFAATKYSQYRGEHRWFNAPSGTAGAGISFTQAMTLQASGTLSIGNTIDYGGIMLTPPAGSYSEGLIINPASSGYSGVYLRLEGAQGANYTGNWVLGKNSSVSTGGEALNIVKQGLTTGTNFRVDAPMTWTTGGNTLVGFNMQIGSTTSLYASGKIQVSGGKSIFSSNDASYSQVQIGNPDSNGEAGICYISGVTAFGASPTSVNGDNYVWAVGAGVYGVSGNNWAIGNKGWSHYNVSIAYNATSWAGYSDERAKDIIKQIDSGLDILRDWRTVYYSFKFDENKKVRLGLVAQDVLKTAPELVEIPEVEYNDKGQLNGMSVYYAETVAVLVKAVQELEAKILALEARSQGA